MPSTEFIVVINAIIAIQQYQLYIVLTVCLNVLN